MIKFKDIKVLEFDRFDHSDFPKYSEAVVSRAINLNTNQELTDEELEFVNDEYSLELYPLVEDEARERLYGG